MSRRRRGVWLGAALGPALLLGACASMKDPVERPRWSYVRTVLPAFWWYQPDLVDVKGARGKAATGAGVVVAIVDTGVLAGHEDLSAPRPGVATCGASATDTGDRNGHGTQLAGIVLGKDPGQSTQGVAPEAALLPIKVDCGLVSADSLTRGIDAAITRGAHVVLLALGAYPPGPPDVEAFLTDRADGNPGVLFVVASVWEGGAHAPFPAWTRRPNVVVVGAMTLDDGKAEVPSKPKGGDLWAPGRDVETASIDPAPAASPHDRFYMQGTSAASAIVAGCAALVRQRTGLAGAALKEALVRTAEPRPDLKPGSDRRINCNKAVP